MISPLVSVIVRSLCKSGVVLKDGQFSFQGTTNDAVDHYLKAYADDYSGMSLGDIPRTDKTNGLIKLVGISFLNENNEIISPHCGKLLRIRLLMKVERGAEQCFISIDVNNIYGDSIMNFPSDVTMDEVGLSPDIH